MIRRPAAIRRTRRLGGFVLAVALASTAVVPVKAAGAGGGPPDAAIKAAFLLNFAKFAEWPALPANAGITLCVIGSEEIARALSDIGRGQSIGGHALLVTRPADSATWPTCQLLFVADAEGQRSAGGLRYLRTLPVLTVSDSNGFSQTTGIIELFVEKGRMRFAINVEAADRAGVHLSSRLLGLAQIVRSSNAP
jgi:YfiR/HmsC-like